jgi:hypothetical protein
MTVPDQFFVLAHRPVGGVRLPEDVFEAGLAAAVLAELRRHGRVEFDAEADDGGTVRARGLAPTGDEILDAVMARVAGEAPHPPYRLLQILGPRVRTAVDDRFRLRMRVHPRRSTILGLDPSGEYAAVRHLARIRIVEAIRTGATNSPAMALGVVLWGAELAGPVMRTSLFSRFWLGRLAARDWLAVAVRTVIGVHIRLPAPPS